MAPVGLLERKTAEDELLLLIREARRRRRRRQTGRALAVLVTSAITALAALAVTGAYSPAANPTGSGRPASAARGCPTSPARFVANGAFTATVLGRGPVRLALGNVYLKAHRRVVLGTTGTPGWSAIEVIWVVNGSYRGSLAVRGRRLQKPGPIDVNSSNANPQSPGSDVLTLSPSSANTMPGSRLYPGVIWVRSAGCYALNVNGRGIRERLALDAQAH